MFFCYEEGHLVVVFSIDHGLLEGGSVDAKLGHLCWLQQLLHRKLEPRTLALEAKEFWHAITRGIWHQLQGRGREATWRVRKGQVCSQFHNCNGYLNGSTKAIKNSTLPTAWNLASEPSLYVLQLWLRGYL